MIANNQQQKAGTSRSDRGRIPTPVLLLLVSVVGVILILVVIRFIYPDAEVIDISFPKGKTVQIKIANGRIGYEQLLDNMFAESFARAGGISWLREHEQLFHVDDIKLSEHLSKLLPEKPSHKSEESSEDRVKRLNAKISQHPVVLDLRQKSGSHKPPFQYVGKSVKIGTPQADKPDQFRVWVPFESEFVGRRIEIRNPRNNRHLILFGWAAFERTGFVDLQLSKKQALYLFLQVPGRTVEGIAFILPGEGRLEDPTGSEQSPIQLDNL